MLGILLPTVPFTQKVRVDKDSTLSQEEFQPLYIYSQDFNIDDNLIDLSDDDVNDTERRNHPLQKITCPLFFVDSQTNHDPLKRDLGSGYSSPLRSSLFIRHRVLRL